MEVNLSELSSDDMISTAQKSERAVEQKETTKVSKAITYTAQVMEVSATEWTLLTEHNAKVYPREHPNVGIPSKCVAFMKGGTMPSDKQLKLAIEIRKNAYADGFDFLT